LGRTNIRKRGLGVKGKNATVKICHSMEEIHMADKRAIPRLAWLAGGSLGNGRRDRDKGY